MRLLNEPDRHWVAAVEKLKTERQPADNRVRDRNLVNVASLQLGEERSHRAGAGARSFLTESETLKS
jgi:hypothetical protein